MLTNLQQQPADALLALIKLHNDDPRADKIDLGVGVYRTGEGDTPVFRSIKAAEAKLVAEQDSKAYLGPEGDMGFVEALMPYVFGKADPSMGGRIEGMQTPGGTGSLRLALAMVKRAGYKRIIVGVPSWPNHAQICADLGLEVVEFNHALASGTTDMDALRAAIADAREGDAILLHGCCHNPTGIDYSNEQWDEIAGLIAASKILPILDLAYQGLGKGMEEDAYGLRRVLAAVPEALIAYSCDKNFGLYRERVGALWVQGANAALTTLAFSNIVALARGIWSMPPDHGAAIVRTILERPAMRAQWTGELDQMRTRINALRTALAAAHPQLAAIAGQRGMFAMLPVSAAAVAAMRADHGIYMAGNGRINIAGLRLDTIPAFVAGLSPHLPSA